MNKNIAIALQEKANEAAFNFSRSDRANNHNNEKFWVEEIQPISAQSAYVIFMKSSGKKAIAHFINKKPDVPHWEYYFIGCQHLLNLNILTEKYLEVEQYNFPINFDNVKKTENKNEVPDVLQEQDWMRKEKE